MIDDAASGLAPGFVAVASHPLARVGVAAPPFLSLADAAVWRSQSCVSSLAFSPEIPLI